MRNCGIRLRRMYFKKYADSSGLSAIPNFTFLIQYYTMSSQIILLSATGSSIGMPSMSSAC